MGHRGSTSLVSAQPGADVGSEEDWPRRQLGNRFGKIGCTDPPIGDGLLRDAGHLCDLVDPYQFVTVIFRQTSSVNDGHNNCVRRSQPYFKSLAVLSCDQQKALLALRDRKPGRHGMMASNGYA